MHRPQPGRPTSARLGQLVLWKRDYRCTSPDAVEQILPPEGSDFLKLVLQLSGHIRVERRGRVALLRPGTWGLYGLSRACNVFELEPSEQLLMLIPRSALSMSNGDLNRLMQRQYATDCAAGAMACRFLTSLYDDVTQSPSIFGPELANVAIHLLQLALTEQKLGETNRSQKDVMKARILAHVELKLGDPNLSVESIAAAMHCSSRYLHKVFAGEESLSRHIWKWRLARCREALEDPGLDHRSVTDIAFSWGFNNASHFSRTFRERFGVTPSEYRAQRRTILTESSHSH